jgi:hypothetical protein
MGSEGEGIMSVWEIERLLDLLALTVLYARSGGPDSEIVLCERKRGYSDDPEIAQLQGKLSTMLAVARRVKGGS